MPKKIKIIILLVAFVATFRATDSKVLAQPSEESIDSAIEIKYKEIQAEIKSIENHPWAGNYRQLGTDEVHVISVAPSGKIVALLECRGTRYENCGTAQITGQELQIKWDYGRPTLLGDHVQLLAIPWGNATFLIPRAEVHSFCLDYRDTHRLPRAERHNYVRSEGEVTLEGEPKLPDEFKLFWDLPLIQGQITSIANVPRKKGINFRNRNLTCTINKGNEDHVFVGMEMYARDKRASWIFTVTAVDEKSATLEISEGTKFKSPRVGIDVTSDRIW